MALLFVGEGEESSSMEDEEREWRQQDPWDVFRRAIAHKDCLFFSDAEENHDRYAPGRCGIKKSSLGLTEGDEREIYYICIEGECEDSDCIDVLKTIGCESGFISCARRKPVSYFYALLDEKQADALLKATDKVLDLCPENELAEEE